jgi:hypothetical protein
MVAEQIWMTGKRLEIRPIVLVIHLSKYRFPQKGVIQESSRR